MEAKAVNICRDLKRGEEKVMRVRLLYPELSGEGVYKKAGALIKKTAEAYMRYAEKKLPRSAAGSSTSFYARVSEGGGFLSVWFDITEYEGVQGGRPALANYRRVSLVWDIAGKYIIKPRALLFGRLAGCVEGDKKQLARENFDGCYIRDGGIYIYRNIYKRGSEKGRRRSEYRHFIKERRVGSLSQCPESGAI